MRNVLVALVAVVLVGANSSAARAAEREADSWEPKPNIVFILCDDLGINDLHCYGRKDHNTPNLDRLAGQGMRFTSAYCAQPICSPSRAAILTGKAPARLHLTTYLPGRPNAVSQKLLHPEIQMQVPLEETTLAEHFKRAGYVTAAIGKWHVGGKGFGPLEQGFDFYHAGKANTKPSETEGGKGEYDLTAAAEKFIDENKDRSFLVYLAHNTPHIPYDAQRPRIEKNARAFEPVYAGVIETLDDTVGRLLAKLDALKLAERTIVVFTSDNGGLHVPEGPHPRITHNTPYRAGKGFVYQGGLRIPLIVRWPGHVPAGKVVDDPVINTGWIPTLLELAGICPVGRSSTASSVGRSPTASSPGRSETPSYVGEESGRPGQPAPKEIDGVSFAAMLTGRGPAPQRPLFWHFPHYTNQGSRPTGAMREGNWMLVEYYDDGKAELYDLSKDIAEARDLAAQQPQRAAAMRTALAAWRKSVSAQSNRPNPDFDPAKFRALYLDLDPSRFDPAQADTAQWQSIWQWRKTMNAVLPRAKKVEMPKGKHTAVDAQRQEPPLTVVEHVRTEPPNNGNPAPPIVPAALDASSAYYCAGELQATDRASKEPLRLQSPNASPGLTAYNGCALVYRQWHKDFHAILAAKNYDLEMQRQIHNSAIVLRQQPFEHLSFLIEGLDNDAYSLTHYGPINCTFKDRSVGDVCAGVLGSAFGQRVEDDTAEKGTSYLDEVICEGKPVADRVELKKCMAQWLEKRKNSVPWEIQYEVLKWTFEKESRFAIPRIDKMPGTNRMDFYRFHDRATREMFRQMQIVKEARRSIQFSVDDAGLDLIDYMSGRFDPK